jgi:hypothetical protein
LLRIFLKIVVDFCGSTCYKVSIARKNGCGHAERRLHACRTRDRKRRPACGRGQVGHLWNSIQSWIFHRSGGGFGETALPSVQAIPTGRAGSPSRPSTLRLSHIQSQQTGYAMPSVRRKLSIATINALCRWKGSLTGSATTVSTLRPRRSRRCVHSPCSQTGK